MSTGVFGLDRDDGGCGACQRLPAQGSHLVLPVVLIEQCLDRLGPIENERALPAAGVGEGDDDALFPVGRGLFLQPPDRRAAGRAADLDPGFPRNVPAGEDVEGVERAQALPVRRGLPRLRVQLRFRADQHALVKRLLAFHQQGLARLRRRDGKGGDGRECEARDEAELAMVAGEMGFESKHGMFSPQQPMSRAVSGSRPRT